MAPSNNYNHISNGKISYTFSEAVEFMKNLDKLPTGVPNITWVDSKTNKKVVIGYS